MTGNTVTNVCHPIIDHDVTNKIYVDQITSDAVSMIMMGNLNMNGCRIKGLPIWTYQKVILTLPVGYK